MKKLFLLTAAFAMTLFASCTKEEMAPQANETTVTYTVEIPDALVKGGDTKAIGDGMNINQLIYEVWKTKNADEQELLDPSKECVRLYQKTAPMVKVGDQIRTVISLNLVQDQEYTILFWAQVKDADAYVTDELTNVTYNYNAAAGEYLSNREDMAAFYGVDFVSDEDPKAKTVYLNRPFAQLNLGTKNTATDYKITMNTTEVVIDNVPTAFNVAKKIALDNAPVAFKFSHGNVPTDPATITVNNQVYEYAAMNYIFAADRGNGGQTATVSYAIKTTLTSKNLDGTPGATTEAIVTNTVENVPLKENFRTNIIGNLLTSTTDYEVIIDASWADEGDGEIVEVWDGKNVQEPYYNPTTQQYEISLATELAWLSSAVNGTLDIETKAASNAPRTFEGETFVLKEDVDLKGKLWVPIGATGNFKGTFDGNGKTIKNLTIKVDDKTPAGLFSDAYSVKNVKVENATIEAHYKTGVIVGDGLCTRIENCEVSNATITVTPLNKDDANHVGGIVGYLSGEPTAYVKGCTVKNATIKGFRDIAAIAGTANKTAVVEGNKAAEVTIIADQTPEYVDNTKDGNAGAIVGRISTDATVKDDNVAGDNIVIKRYVDSTEELAAAVADAKDGDVIYIGAGEVVMPYFTDKAINFEGIHADAVVKQSPASHIDEFYKGAELNFKNVTLVGTAYAGNTQGYQKSVKETYTDCKFVDYIMFAGDETVVDNCTFTGNQDQYFWTGSADNITFNNCKFTTSIGRAVKVCTVGNAGDRKVTFNNCEFTATAEKKAALEIDGTKGSTYTVNINNCTETGFAAGEFTGETLFNVEGADNVTVYVDGNKWTGNGIFEDENGNMTITQDAGLKAAVATEGAQVTLKAGNYTFPGSSFKSGVVVNCEEGTVFTGNSKLNINGATVIGATFSNPSGSAVDQTINGTFKDCTFEGQNGLRWAYAGETVVFENCVFSGSVYGAHFDGGANDILFKNCTFSGFNAFGSAITLVTFEDCTFKPNGKSGYNGANLWGNTKMINTKFEFDGTCTEWVDPMSKEKTYSFTGCNINEGSMVNTNYIWAYNDTKITIDNVEYTYTNDYLVSNGIATVCNNDGLTAALKDGETNINLIPGNYALAKPTITGETVKIEGANKEQCIVNITKQIRATDGKTVLTLKNLTVDVPTGLNYDEHNFAWIHYLKEFNMIDCISNGRIRLNTHSANIQNCTFNVTTSSGFDGYAVQYQGANNSTTKISGCTFNTAGKAIVMYNEGTPTLNMDVENCTFISSDTSTDKAAIQMHTEWGISGTLDITNCTATGFIQKNNGLWNELNNNTKQETDKFEITVNGNKVH